VDEVLVDARGARCPVPVVEAARAARGRPPGTVLRVLATDPATAHDLPAWCRMRGHELIDVRRSEDEDVVEVRVRLR
jgi:tRNA 2-thiouridine synthesizing protein A